MVQIKLVAKEFRLHWQCVGVHDRFVLFGVVTLLSFLGTQVTSFELVARRHNDNEWIFDVGSCEEFTVRYFDRNRVCPGSLRREQDLRLQVSFFVIWWNQIGEFLFLAMPSFLNPQIDEHVEFANVMEKVVSAGKILSIFISSDVGKL